MLPFRRWTRILILSFLTVSVFVPIVLLSHRLKQLNSDVSKEFVEDLSIIDDGQLLQEPSREVYKDVGFSSGVSLISSGEDDSSIDSEKVSTSFDEENRGSESENTLSTSDDENKSSKSRKVVRRSDEENTSSESVEVLSSSDEQKRSGFAQVLSSPDKEKSGNRLSAFDEDNNSVSVNALSVSDKDNSSNESGKEAEDFNMSNRNGTRNDKGDNRNKKEADSHTLQEGKYLGKNV